MEWISVKNRMPDPGVKVIAYFKNEYGKDRRIMAMYAPKFTIEEDLDDEYSDYDEKTDRYYVPEGWWEQNEFDECHYAVDGKITHWMKLPGVPK